MLYRYVCVLFLLCGCEGNLRRTHDVSDEQREEMRHNSAHELASLRTIIALDVFAEKEEKKELSEVINRAKTAIVERKETDPFLIAAVRDRNYPMLMVYYFDSRNEINEVKILGENRKLLFIEGELIDVFKGLSCPWRTLMAGNNTRHNIREMDRITNEMLLYASFIQIVASGGVIAECEVTDLPVD